MVSKKVTIQNLSGLHLRPAVLLCKAAIKYESVITITFKETTANAKNVLSILSACIKAKDEIELVCEGEDEQEALEALVKIIETGLGD